MSPSPHSILRMMEAARETCHWVFNHCEPNRLAFTQNMLPVVSRIHLHLCFYLSLLTTFKDQLCYSHPCELMRKRALKGQMAHAGAKQPPMSLITSVKFFPLWPHWETTGHWLVDMLQNAQNGCQPTETHSPANRGQGKKRDKILIHG
jgi:hypothetical protein